PSPLSNTILVLQLSSLSQYEHVGHLISQAARKTKTRLLILLYSPLFDPENGIKPVQSWHSVERLLSFIYTRASAVALELDRILLQIDVLFYAGPSIIVSDIDGQRRIKWDAVFLPSEGAPSFSRRSAVWRPDN